MKKYISIILMCLVALSCEDKLAQLDVVEFGAALNADYPMPLNYKAGSFEIEVVSDGDYVAQVDSDCDWIWFEGTSKTYQGGGSDESLTVYYDANRTILRTGKITLTRKHRKVELEISQVGILSEDFSIAHQNLWAQAQGGQLSAKVLTLSGPDDLEIETTYLEEGYGQWISQARMENNYLKFNVSENLTAQPRHAVITVLKKGTSLSGKIQVGQAAAGVQTQEVSLTELKSMLSESASIKIENNLVLTGCIALNDNVEGNGGENINITSTIQDLTVADRTLYVSDAEGTNGVRIDFNKGAELLVKRFDHLEISLAGATVTKEDNPERYIISGLSATAIMKNEPGTVADVVIKQKKMSELQPSDVYTLVELTGCEMPIAKGPYIGVDVSNYSIINKYPMVIRDAEGTTMHMMVNTTCTWHRDGTERPKGAGNITGIIVHEHCDNFEWDQAKADQMISGGLGVDYVNNLGEIGTYQIRPISKADIALDEDFDNGFSSLVCEFTYIYSAADQKLIPNYDDNELWYYKNGNPHSKFTLMSKTKGKLAISSKRDWTMLGPYKDGQLTDITTGNGIWCAGQKAVWFISGSQENLGRTQGRIDKTCGSAWNTTGWDALDKYWQIDFSTADLTDENAPMSVQLGAVNGYGDRIGGPRNWKMVYTTSDNDTEIEIARYTVPDFPLKGNRRVWHCPGHKYMSFTLPKDADVWNKSRVTIKLIPVDKAADNGDSYSHGTINTNVDNAINYFAVRYNK